jgi:phage tail-like protein
MAQAKSARRFNPYKNFKFWIKFGDKTDPVAGISKMSALRRTTEVVKHRDGGDHSSSRKTPGRTEYEPITLERGVTHDKDFEQWANLAWFREGGPGKESALKDFRRNITIEVLNEAGDISLRYFVYDCWVSEFQAVSDLDSNANAVIIEHIKLEHHGWLRDDSLKEPDVKTYLEPPNG